MIELVIAFLISIGWFTPNEGGTLEVNELGEDRYGIVVVEGVGNRSGTVIYNENTKVFEIIE